MEKIQKDLEQIKGLIDDMNFQMENLDIENKQRAEEAMEHIHKGIDMMKGLE